MDRDSCCFPDYPIYTVGVTVVGISLFNGVIEVIKVEVEVVEIV